jgi:renalase
MKVVIVGAGMAGACAAAALVDGGHQVVLLDKGRGVGGRMATRRIGDATLDHGAQFFTVRTDEFAKVVDPLIRSGVVAEWCRGFGRDPDGHPRYRGTSGMASVVKHVLPAGCEVRTGCLVFAIHRAATGWRVMLDDGSGVDADAVIVTAPLPQAFSLLVAADVEMPEALFRTEYDRTLGLLAVLDRPLDIDSALLAAGPSGGVRDATGFTFIADNQRKGLSVVPAVTFHFDPAFSEASWDDDRDVIAAAMIERARPWLGTADIVDVEVKRWRFATPRTVWPERTWLDSTETIALAGDAFAGPRVEGAALSGIAAAGALVA